MLCNAMHCIILHYNTVKCITVLYRKSVEYKGVLYSFALPSLCLHADLKLISAKLDSSIFATLMCNYVNWHKNATFCFAPHNNM